MTNKVIVTYGDKKKRSQEASFYLSKLVEPLA